MISEEPRHRNSELALGTQGRPYAQCSHTGLGSTVRAILPSHNELLVVAQDWLSQIDLEKVHAAGIRKSREMIASSTIQVAYPPLASLSRINGNSLRLQSRKRQASLYVHIPFCTGICTFCGFSRRRAPRSRLAADKMYDDYLALLDRELTLLLHPDVSSLSKQVISSLYVGGGTPTILGAERIEQLIGALRMRLDIPTWAEVTVEGSPETISDETVQALVEVGCNRLSMGVQTFDDSLLEQIGRRHTGLEAEAAIATIRKWNLDNINIDLIRGFPGQDTESIFRDLCRIEEIGPPSVTVYHLVVKPRTGLAIVNRRHPEVFPDERDILLLHRFLIEGMKTLGYTQWPIDWFLRDSQTDQCVQQKHKWMEDTDLIGIGCSSYSFYNNIQYYNERSLVEYGRAVHNGRLPIAAAQQLDAREQFRRRTIFGLRYGIDCERLETETGFSVEESFAEEIERLFRAGLLSIDENALHLTELGMLFADETMAEFYAPQFRATPSAGCGPLP